MKPFILAFGRKTITELIEPYLEKIEDLITDGFKSIIELEKIELGDAVGDLRYDGIV